MYDEDQFAKQRKTCHLDEKQFKLLDARLDKYKILKNMVAQLKNS